MTDRERLINLICDTPTRIMGGNMFLEKISTDIADYLLANGVIVPPCKVGQTVYYVDDYVEEIEECKVYGFTVVNGKLSLLVDNGECKFVTRKWHNTKEEAEEKLKELKDNA